jgi:ABC-type dipeptide/oligopeptide/nickel transport system permease subunit
MDLVYGFPAILLTLVVISILTPSLGNAMIAITIIFIPLFARVARATALIELGKQYVEAAQAIGVPTWRVLSHHVGPNIAVPLIVQATAMMGYAITIEAALSFLGLGAQPPTPSWGSMLASGRDLLSSTPWVAIASGGSISLAVLGFNLLGDGLRDALDPVLKV